MYVATGEGEGGNVSGTLDCLPRATREFTTVFICRSAKSSIAPTPIVEELVAHGDIASVLGIGCHDVLFYSGGITGAKRRPRPYSQVRTLRRQSSATGSFFQTKDCPSASPPDTYPRPIDYQASVNGRHRTRFPLHRLLSAAILTVFTTSKFIDGFHGKALTLGLP
ncbi:hypothetical protein EV363DRAFT_49111 [Boletus edulis]|nr:hypothetical protein EV363DRAFT_49111 [Boletus edulis]